jgi:hypothetical protein
MGPILNGDEAMEFEMQLDLNKLFVEKKIYSSVQYSVLIKM